MGKQVYYPCPKCEAVGDPSPKKALLTCPQCGNKYRKADAKAFARKEAFRG